MIIKINVQKVWQATMDLGNLTGNVACIINRFHMCLILAGILILLQVITCM